jgi:hypothetical protein
MRESERERQTEPDTEEKDRECEECRGRKTDHPSFFPLLEGSLKEELKHLFPADTWDALSPEICILFWSLNSSDLFVRRKEEERKRKRS